MVIIVMIAAPYLKAYAALGFNMMMTALVMPYRHDHDAGPDMVVMMVIPVGHHMPRGG
jgi:hypothetical protein